MEAHGYAVAIGERLLFPAFRLETEALAHAAKIAETPIVADSRAVHHVRVVPVIVTASDA